MDLIGLQVSSTLPFDLLVSESYIPETQTFTDEPSLERGRNGVTSGCHLMSRLYLDIKHLLSQINNNIVNLKEWLCRRSLRSVEDEKGNEVLYTGNN